MALCNQQSPGSFFCFNGLLSYLNHRHVYNISLQSQSAYSYFSSTVQHWSSPSTPTVPYLHSLDPQLHSLPVTMSETAVEPLSQQPDPVQEARDAVNEPSTDVYHNPLEDSSRMGLSARVYGYRYGASIAFGIGNMAYPPVPSPHKTIYLDSTLSPKYSGKEKFKALVWTPDRPKALSRKVSRESVKSLKKEEKALKKEEKRRLKVQKKEAKSGKVYGDTDLLDPALSRISSSSSILSNTDDEALASSAKRPSTLSRISFRISNRSSKSISKMESLSSTSLAPDGYPPSTAATPGSVTDNPMDKIPTMLTPQADPRARRPAVINFHGGGFVLGQGTDDSRWAMAVMQALGAVVFSVEYRLAPSYPFPTPVEDCADAILQIWKRADEFWIDRDKIILSGFSAGGTLALASWVLLNDYKTHGYDIKPDPNLAADMAKLSVEDQGGDPKDPNVPHPVGLMLYYPLLDWTQSRPRKRLTCVKPEFTLPRNLTDLFDAAYLYPHESVKSQLDHPLLSPGLMPDNLIDKLPPIQLCLCEHDMLLAEGQRFATRLQKRNKTVGYRVVKEAKHAWDKPLPFSPPGNLGDEYGEAVRVMAGWLGREEGNGIGEDLGQASSLVEEVVPEEELV